MPAKPSPIATHPKPTPTFPLSTTFRADPSADVIIRTEGAVDFRAHKCILSLASPIFKDMFAVPQPPTGTPGVLPHIDVQDLPGAWENILRTIYPMLNPTIDNLDDLECFLLTAKKYEMQCVIDSYKPCFEDQVFIQSDPLRLYAIACACGFEEQAKYVARRAKHQTVVGRSGVGDLKGLTLDSYHRFVSFLAERDNQWHRTLTKNQIPHGFNCSCDLKSIVFHRLKADLEKPDLSTDEIYLKAREGSFKPCAGRCATDEIKGFIDLIAREKDTICDKLMWQ